MAKQNVARHNKLLLALLGVMVLLVGGAFITIQSAPQADERRTGFGIRTPQTDRYYAGTLTNPNQQKKGFSLKYPFTSNGKLYTLSPQSQPVQQKLDLYVKDKKAVVVKGRIRTSNTINISDIALIPTSQDVNTTGTLTERANDPDWRYTFKAKDGTEYRANAVGAVAVSLNTLIGKNVQLKGASYKYEFTKESFTGLYINEASEVKSSSSSSTDSTKLVIDSVTPASAAPGEEVTIKGSNLADQNSPDGKTYFALILNDKYSWSFAKEATANELKTAIPLKICANTDCSTFDDVKAGQYNLAIENNGQKSNTISFTVKSKTTTSTVELSNLSPTSGPRGTTITFEAKNFPTDRTVAEVDIKSPGGYYYKKVEFTREGDTAKFTIAIPEGECSSDKTVQAGNYFCFREGYKVASGDKFEIFINDGPTNSRESFPHIISKNSLYFTLAE